MPQRHDHAWQVLPPRCHTRRFVFWSVVLVLWGGIPFHGGAAQPTRVAIGLIGNLPHSPEDKAKFPHLMQALNEAYLAFVVHVGDIEWSPRGYMANKTGTIPCTDATFGQRKALFQTSKHPFILTLGDDDWTNCHQVEPPPDPIERPARRCEVFFQGDQSLGQRTLPLTRQSTDPQYAKFSENVRWTSGEVLLVTLHMVGSNKNRERTPEGDGGYAERKAANLVWLKQAFELAKRHAYKGLMLLTQANRYFEDHWQPRHQQSLHIAPPKPKPTGYGDFLSTLEAEVLLFDKPMAPVQGDTRYVGLDKPLFSITKQRTIEHITRVEVYGTPNIHWVRGIMDPSDPQIFTFEPEIV